MRLRTIVVLVMILLSGGNSVSAQSIGIFADSCKRMHILVDFLHIFVY